MKAHTTKHYLDFIVFTTTTLRISQDNFFLVTTRHYLFLINYLYNAFKDVMSFAENGTSLPAHDNIQDL